MLGFIKDAFEQYVVGNILVEPGSETKFDGVLPRTIPDLTVENQQRILEEALLASGQILTNDGLVQARELVIR